jgi:hypothetical protein
MKHVKIAPMFMISIMVLAGVGVSYAHWEEKLFVEGIMYTDDIDPYFHDAVSNDPCDYAQFGMVLDPWECGYWPPGSRVYDQWVGDRKNKDVGCTDIELDTGGTTATITVRDAYPCYYSHVYWEINNAGSVPVNLVSYKLTNLSFAVDTTGDGNNDIDVVIPKNKNLVINTEYYVKWNDDQSVVIREGAPANPDNWDFMIMPTGDFAITDQLDPERWIDDGKDHHADPAEAHYTFHADLCIHFLNGCWQLATYDFDLEMVFWNWPELCEIDDFTFHNADLMLVLDKSSSIDATELADLKTAANAFIDAIHSNDAITGQTSFNDNGYMDRHLTSNAAACHAAVNALTTSGYTNLYEGLLLAYNELMAGTYDASLDTAANSFSSVGDREPDGDYPDYIVCITDGYPNRPLGGIDPHILAAGVADDCDSAGIVIYVVGVGTTVDTRTYLMDDIATSHAHYFDAADYDDLEQILIDLVSGP